MQTGGLVPNTVAETGTPGGYIRTGGGSKEVQMKIKAMRSFPYSFALFWTQNIFVSNIVKGGPEISCLSRR